MNRLLEIRWDYLFDPNLAWESLPILLEGFKITVYLALWTILFSLILGVIFAIMRMSKIKLIRYPAQFIISMMRGTPMLVFLFLLFYGLPVIGIEIESALVAAVIGMSINFAAYEAEIVRSAISSVPKGQWEAAMSLQMNQYQILWRIVIPQATRIAVPPTFSVFMDIVKGTSLASVITVSEMFYNAKVVAGRTFDSMTMYITAALIYWAATLIIGFIQGKLEKRYNRYLNQV